MKQSFFQPFSVMPFGMGNIAQSLQLYSIYGVRRENSYVFVFSHRLNGIVQKTIIRCHELSQMCRVLRSVLSLNLT